MDEESSFIFYDSGYLQESFSAFQDMRIKGEHTDVTIKGRNGLLFPAHRVVLAARIPHFRKILFNQDKEISLNDINSDVLGSIIDFAYEGKVKVTAASVHLMLFAAVCLRLDQVQKACIEFQARRFNSSGDVNTIKLIPSDVKIRNNFDEFYRTDEFLFLPYYSIKDIISRDDVKVESENKVFEAVMNWIKVSPMERRHRLPYLLPEIRMNYLSPEFLVEKVMSEVLVKTSDQCTQIVEEAKNYHLLKKRPASLSFKTTSRMYADPHKDVTSDLNTSVTANHCNLLHNDTGNTDTNERVTCNIHEDHSSEHFRNGIYAIRSICPIGTFVSNYDTRSRKWDNFSSISSSECALQAVTVGEKIFVFFRKTIEMFNLVSREWYTVGPVPITTECSGIVSDDNKIYVFGGLELPEIVRCFDTQKNQWLQDQPMCMPCHSMSVVSSPETDIFFTGGGYGAFCSNALIKFHPVTKRWTHVSSMISNRMDHASAVLNGKLYVCGGRNNQVEFLETVEAYDLLSHRWTFVSFLKISRYSHSLVTWDKRLYVFGGVTKEQVCSSDVEVYDPQVNEWMLGLAAPPNDHRTDGDMTGSLCSKETVLVNLRALTVTPAR